MGPSELLRWQWSGYSRYHRSRTNLFVHIVAVPLFLVGNVSVVVALFRGSLGLAALGVACTVVSLALQGRGHGAEENPPEPFTGPANAVGRLLLEQWVTFPRFVLSGGWWRALRPTADAEGSKA